MREITRPRVAIESTELQPVETALAAALDFVGLDTLVPKGARVTLKPNFTYPTYKPGVTTSPAFLRAVVAAIAPRAKSISIVESNGGANAWTADEAFEGHGLLPLAKEYGVKLVNLTNGRTRAASAEVAGRTWTLDLPTLLLDETDAFITLPVPKVHVMTGMSLGFKNQWGCIPDVLRLRHHPDFPSKILALHKLFRTRGAIFDGTYFLNRTGPMDGDEVRKNLVIAANDVGAGSLVAATIMGMDPEGPEHLRLAVREGLMSTDLATVDCNIDPRTLMEQRFRVERELTHYVGLAAFHSRIITWIGYQSPMASLLHELLYLVRGRPTDIHPKW